MASYKARATAIYELVADLRQTLELHVDASPADKAALIDFTVETVNKLLYCFLISQEMFDRIDDLLNNHLDIAPDPQAIAELYLRALGVVRMLEAKAYAWIVKYSPGS